MRLILALALLISAAALIAIAATQKSDVVLHAEPMLAMRIEFSPDGELAAITTKRQELSFLSLRTWRSWKCQIATRGDFDFVDGKRVAVVGADGRVYLVEAGTGKSLSSFAVPSHAIGAPTVLNGKALCVPLGSPQGRPEVLTTLWVTDLSGRKITSLTTLAASASPCPQPARFSPDGQWLVALGWDRAVVYSASSWKKVADIKWRIDGFLTLCEFSSNGKLAYLGDESHQMIVETGTWKHQEVPMHPGHHIVAAFPSGTGFLVSLTDASLRESSDTLMRVVPGPADGQSGDCIAAALGPRGFLLTGWENGDVRRQVVTLK